jgi:hypothetical protein
MAAPNRLGQLASVALRARCKVQVGARWAHPIPRFDLLLRLCQRNGAPRKLAAIAADSVLKIHIVARRTVPVARRQFACTAFREAQLDGLRIRANLHLPIDGSNRSKRFCCICELHETRSFETPVCIIEVHNLDH